MEIIKSYIRMWKISVISYKNAKKNLVIAFIMILTISLLNSSLPYLLKIIIDTANSTNYNVDISNIFSLKNLYFLVFIYSAAWLISQIIEWSKNIFTSLLSSSFESSIITYSLKDFLSTNKNEQDKVDIGEFNTDVFRAGNAFSTLNNTFFFVLLPIILQLIFMSLILYKNIGLNFSLFFIFSAVLIFFISNKINKESRKYFEPLYKSRNILNSFFLEKIQNTYDVKINNSINYESKNFQKSVDNFIKQTVHSNLKIGILMIFQLLFIFLFLITFLVMSVYLFSKSNITSGDFVMISSYIIMLTSPFLMISQHVMLINGHLVSIKKLENYLSLEKSKNSKDFFYDREHFFNFINCTLEIGKKIIKNFNLTIMNNKVYVIVGKTGVGKTSIINYMLGLYKVNDGDLYYKSLNISKHYSEKIFEEVAFIGQNYAIYNGSLKDNLIYNSQYEYSDSELYDLIKKFDLINILENNNLTLDSNINEVIKSFSGGEKQRLNIIRGVLKRPKLLILDEPTSALDYKTASKILSFLKSNFSTLVIISHSSNCIDIADEILDFDILLKSD